MGTDSLSETSSTTVLTGYLPPDHVQVMDAGSGRSVFEARMII